MPVLKIISVSLVFEFYTSRGVLLGEFFVSQEFQLDFLGICIVSPAPGKLSSLGHSPWLSPESFLRHSVPESKQHEAESEVKS